jgi:PAS domain S-box-containing protein
MRDVKSKSIEKLQAELEELRHQLFEANETIEAIRTGQVDALVVESQNEHKLYTLKSADQAYRVFIEKMNEGALTLNKEGVVLYCNSQFATMVGQQISSVIGVVFENFIEPSDKEVYNSIFQESWKKDCKAEICLKAEDGYIPVQLSLAVLSLDEQSALSVILTDLSNQKKTQQELENTNEQLASINHALELSNHDLQQFASVASHDLQEPLRKIQIFANLLMGRHDDTLNSETKKYVEKIIYSAARMKTLITDVLNYSKLSANDNIFELVNLTELVKDLIEDFELMIIEKNAMISFGSLCSIYGNKGQIRQVFQNIISNSLKFSKRHEPPQIEIKSTRHRDKAFGSPVQNDGPYCIISIKDNGIGFDEKYLAQIFDIFERLHTRDTYEGTGIGLAITKKIMDKHNGLVSAKSNSGQGAEFLLLFPIDQQSQVVL